VIWSIQDSVINQSLFVWPNAKFRCINVTPEPNRLINRCAYYCVAHWALCEGSEKSVTWRAQCAVDQQIWARGSHKTRTWQPNYRVLVQRGGMQLKRGWWNYKYRHRPPALLALFNWNHLESDAIKAAPGVNMFLPFYNYICSYHHCRTRHTIAQCGDCAPVKWGGVMTNEQLINYTLAHINNPFKDFLLDYNRNWFFNLKGVVVILIQGLTEKENKNLPMQKNQLNFEESISGVEVQRVKCAAAATHTPIF
jgi:hypothetical protein